MHMNMQTVYITMKIKHSTYNFKSNKIKSNQKFNESAFVLNLGRGEPNIGRAFHSQRRKEKTPSLAVDNLTSSGNKRSFKSCPKVQFINSTAFPPFSFIHQGDQSSLHAIFYNTWWRWVQVIIPKHLAQSHHIPIYRGNISVWPVIIKNIQVKGELLKRLYNCLL